MQTGFVNKNGHLEGYGLKINLITGDLTEGVWNGLGKLAGISREFKKDSKSMSIVLYNEKSEEVKRASLPKSG